MKPTITILTYILIVLPCIVVSYPAVALMLLTAWNGRTTIFGNAKHGYGEDRGYIGYWQEFAWLVWRNPVNNLLSDTLAVRCSKYVLIGDSGIGDKSRGGFYKIIMDGGWEYYWIKPYGKRCIRLRMGWKIQGKKAGELCEWVLSFNPMHGYSGT